MKNETPALNDAELDTVTGGLSMLTLIQTLQHDTAKAVIQNIRV